MVARILLAGCISAYGQIGRPPVATETNCMFTPSLPPGKYQPILITASVVQLYLSVLVIYSQACLGYPTFLLTFYTGLVVVVVIFLILSYTPMLQVALRAFQFGRNRFVGKVSLKDNDSSSSGRDKVSITLR